ncbi:MAG: hypothetical protein ACE37F_17905 [Nannocystaceae bacterium]|nr:hypothetical protein [bacterium]
MKWFRLSAPALFIGVLVSAGACDEDEEPADEQASRDVPPVVDGCPDDGELVDIGETRVCTCDDGTESEQICLSTGAFADCMCVGGGW